MRTRALTLGICLALVPIQLFAGTSADSTSTSKTTSIGISAGTQGIGINAKMRLHPHWYLDLGLSDLPVDYSGAIKLDGYNTKMHLVTGFTNIHLLAEWQPLKNWFRFVGGGGYFANASIKGTITVKDAQKFGDLTIQPSQIGEIDATIDWKGLAPYLGISLFKAQPTRKVNFNIDLGTYYFLQQDVTMSGTDLLSGNNANTSQLKQNLNDYRWLPVIQFNLNYKITK